MSLKDKLTSIIDQQLRDVDLDLLFEQCSLSLVIDKWMLETALECIYYRSLINKKPNQEALDYLSLLRTEDAKIGMLTYCYIIYKCDKWLHKKRDSEDNLGIYI